MVLLNPRRDPLHLDQEVLEALRRWNRPPRLFVREGRLVRVLEGAEGPILEELDEAALSGVLLEAMQFVRVGRGKGFVLAPPPPDLVRRILRRGSWPLPALEGVIATPFVRPDGTVCTEAGYDRTTRLYFAPRGLQVPSVPLVPLPEDVQKARAVVEDPLVDFPFADEASRANALALLLTPLLQPAIGAPVPLFLIDKPSPGTGATLLAQVVKLIADGSVGVGSPPEGEEEARKLITATLLAGPAVQILDDVTTVQIRTLSRLLTAGAWEDRVLGSNRRVRLPQRTTWVATGNNIALGADLARRAVWIRLDAKHFRPWERTGFRHPNLLDYVGKHRGPVLGALLTLARAWYAAGCPPAEVLGMGNFQCWAEVTGGILAHAGISGFLQNREELLEQVNLQDAGWDHFLRAVLDWTGGEAFTAKELAERINGDAELRESVPEDLLDRELTAKRLGEALRRRVGRRYTPDGLRVERAGRDREGVHWVVKTDAEGSP